MEKAEVLDRIARGRTDYVHELLRFPDWRSSLHEGRVRPLQWFVYYDDVTAMKVVLEAGGGLRRRAHHRVPAGPRCRPGVP
jgi:hypothetical protein